MERYRHLLLTTYSNFLIITNGNLLSSDRFMKKHEDLLDDILMVPDDG